MVRAAERRLPPDGKKFGRGEIRRWERRAAGDQALTTVGSILRIGHSQRVDTFMTMQGSVQLALGCGCEAETPCSADTGFPQASTCAAGVSNAKARITEYR